MVKVFSKRNWTDPKGVDHKAGDTDEVDPSVVFDLDDLVRIGTVEKVVEVAEPFTTSSTSFVDVDGNLELVKPSKKAGKENF